MRRGDRKGSLVPFTSSLSSGVGILLLAAMAILYASCKACNGDPELKMAPPVPQKERDTVRLTMGGVEVILETALNDAERAQGLKWRTHLEPNRGMIFAYPSSQYMSFWMMDTKIPLSIAFIKEDGIVLNIYNEMRPGVISPGYASEGICRFAIEMNKGWFEDHGIKAGDRIALTEEILNLEAEESNL